MTGKTLLEKLQRGRLIAAHRGHRSLFPENTLAAFQDCPGKCDFIELDIRFSKDGVPVVFHDHTLQRTSDIERCGLFPGREDQYLETFDFEELQKLDIGSWFYQTDPWKQIACGKAKVPASNRQSQTISDLGSVLAFIREQGLGINVEIKSLHADQTKSAADIVQLIHDQGVTEQCVISAFDHDILRHITDLDKEITVAALVEKVHPESDVIGYLKSNCFKGYHMEDSMVDGSDVEALIKSGIFVCVYTVNDEKRKQELLDMGVSAVITDFL